MESRRPLARERAFGVGGSFCLIPGLLVSLGGHKVRGGGRCCSLILPITSPELELGELYQ